MDNYYDPDQDDSNLTRDCVTGCEPGNEKAELVRAAMLAYARTTGGRERSLCESLAAQAEDMVEAIAQ